MTGAAPRDIVALGGGTGLPVVLSALREKALAGDISVTAVVNVVDDGGSSGRIRELLNTLPPGDVRNCLVACARRDDELRRLFSYRFSTQGELDGHSLGNLMIAALAVMDGDFRAAVDTVAEILDCWARVIPVANEPLTLHAVTATGARIYGQASVALTYDPINRVYLAPEAPMADTRAIAAIHEAEVVLIGPGSLYSSIIPVLLVPEIREALAASPARKVYICNTMSYRAESIGYDACQHLDAIRAHAGAGVVDSVIAHDPASFSSHQLEVGVARGAVPVDLSDGCPELEWTVLDLADEQKPFHHSPGKLLRALGDSGLV